MSFSSIVFSPNRSPKFKVRDQTFVDTYNCTPVTGPHIGGDWKPRRDFFVPRIGSHGSMNFNIIRVGVEEETRLAREFLTRIFRDMRMKSYSTLRQILISRRTRVPFVPLRYFVSSGFARRRCRVETDAISRWTNRDFIVESAGESSISNSFR